MDVLKVISSLKPLSGLIVGVCIGSLLLAVQAPAASLIGAIILLLFITFSGNVDIFVGFLLWLIAVFIEKRFQFMEKILASIPLAEGFGGRGLGDFAESAFRYISLYVCCLTLAIILLKIYIRDENGIPDHINAKVSLGCGLAAGGVIWWLASIQADVQPWIVLVWGLTGAGLGFIASLIPGPIWK